MPLNEVKSRKKQSKALLAMDKERREVRSGREGILKGGREF